MARELESGTYQLAWTQSIARTRLLAVKVGIVGLASVAIGYAAFAFALGISAGTIPPRAASDGRNAGRLRHRARSRERLGETISSGPAHAHNAIFCAPRARPPFGPKTGFVTSVGGAPPHPGDWALSSKTITTTRQVITPQNQAAPRAPTSAWLMRPSSAFGGVAGGLIGACGFGFLRAWSA